VTAVVLIKKINPPNNRKKEDVPSPPSLKRIKIKKAILITKHR
jgi:hypothetical protein